jgi:hypothetical protein
MILKTNRLFFISAPKVRDMPAQGNALGILPATPVKPYRGAIEMYHNVWQGRWHRVVRIVYFAPSGLCELAESRTQGVALGYHISPFQGVFRTTDHWAFRRNWIIA